MEGKVQKINDFVKKTKDDISNANIFLALTNMRSFAEQNNPEIENEIIVLSARCKKNEEIARMGTESFETIKLERNRIYRAALEILTKIKNSPKLRLETLDYQNKNIPSLLYDQGCERRGFVPRRLQFCLLAAVNQNLKI